MDAAFLYVETQQTPMHAAALLEFELPEGYRGSFFDDFRKHLLERTHLMPFLHQHLHATPLGLDHPVWIEDETFDIDYHLRHLALPPPGGTDELTRLIETLYPPLLDRSRPLWEYTLIEGLRSGRIVLFTKAHHACLDGVAYQAMHDVFYSHTAEPGPVPPGREALRQEPEPGPLRMLRSASAHLLGQPRRTLRGLPEAARTAFKLSRRAIEGRLPRTAPRTRFDVQVTDRRRFAITSLSLTRVKRIGRARGVTINDVVMALCGGALRRYLAERSELPEDPLIAFAPVSLRARGDTGVDNQVFGMVSSLATDVADPLERLSAVHEALLEAKALMEDLRDAIPADFALLGAPTLIQGIFGAMAALHLPERLPQLFNVTVSNVPGPQTPLYVSGARMVAQYPMSIVQHGCALNITIMGIMDSLDFGFTACARAVPDVDVLCAYLVDAFHDLEQAVG
jgi:WS/DGAT/MGAT family acyltransferase